MGLDIYFHKCKRSNFNAYNKAIEEWQNEEPQSGKISHEDYEKLSEDEKNKIQKEVSDWYNKRPEMAAHGISDIGYFRKVNFLMEFFSYEGNCEFKEIAKSELEDLVERTDKLMACKPVRKVKHFYGLAEYAKDLVKTIEETSGSVKDFLEGMSEENIKSFISESLANADVPENEKTIHEIRYALGLDKPVKNEDYWVEKIYSKADQELAEDLLPTQSGFFYGSTEYNHYYWEEVKEVNEWVKGVLNDLKKGEIVLMYCWW